MKTCLALFIVLITAVHAWPLSVGPLSAGAGANDASVGTLSWSDTGNIFASDDSWATCTVNTGQTTNYLVATNFGFALDSKASITGIYAEFERCGASAMAQVNDSSIRIVKGGVVGSTERSGSLAWNIGCGGEAYATFGSSSDLWGETWTASDINASNFGLAISCVYFGGITSTTARVDHVRITVFYTLLGKQLWQTQEIFD